MKLFGIFIAGLASGILGGMGMGGGTILIPALTAIFGVEQRLAQTINLVSFVPAAVVSVFFHVKNDLVKAKGLAPLVISALSVSVAVSFAQNLIEEKIRRKIFGLFLTALALFQASQLQKAGNKSENARLFVKIKSNKKNRKSVKNR